MKAHEDVLKICDKEEARVILSTCHERHDSNEKLFCCCKDCGSPIRPLLSSAHQLVNCPSCRKEFRPNLRGHEADQIFWVQVSSNLLLKRESWIADCTSEKCKGDTVTKRRIFVKAEMGKGWQKKRNADSNRARKAKKAAKAKKERKKTRDISEKPCHETQKHTPKDLNPTVEVASFSVPQDITLLPSRDLNSIFDDSVKPFLSSSSLLSFPEAVHIPSSEDSHSNKSENFIKPSLKPDPLFFKTTQRLYIKNCTEEDAEDYFRYLYSDAVVMEKFAIGKPRDLLYVKKRVNDWAQRWRENQQFSAFTIHLRNGEFLGTMVLGGGDEPNSSEIAGLLRKDKWFNGYASEAMNVLIEHAFFLCSNGNKLPNGESFEKMIATCRRDNHVSQLLLKMRGFSKYKESEKFGCMRDHFMFEVPRYNSVYDLP